jgi:hypothetical protein
MLPENPLIAPVPCKDQYEPAPLTQEHTLGDVVESRPPVDPRLHLDRVVKFDATAPLRRVASSDVAHQRHDDHYQYDDSFDHDDRSAGNDDDCASFLGKDRDADHYGAGSLDGERLAKRQILERDRFERRVSRERTRRERLERRTERSTQPVLQARRSSPRRPGNVGRRLERAGDGNPRLFRLDDPGDVPVRDRGEGAMSGVDHRDEPGEFTDVAADAGPLNRPLSARVHGTALVLYFLLLPYVVLSKWHHTTGDAHATLVRALLVVLAIFWLGFLVQVVRNVTQLRHGRRVKAGGSAWLAGLVVAMLALLAPTSHMTFKEAIPITIPFHDSHQSPTPPKRSDTIAGMGSLPLALMAKRRGDLLRQQPDEASDFDVDESIELLRARNPDLICHLVTLIGERLDGVLDVKESEPTSALSATSTPLVACVLAPSAAGTLIGFAHEGGRLPVAPSWSSDDIAKNVVALHDGKVVFAKSEPELLRALATRTLRQNVVVYLGAASQLDDELAACAVTVVSHVSRSDEGPSLPIAPAQASDLRVELLRADPVVEGLAEPFAPTLRRRCIEMVAYLALHRREPVTGERLRTRVLAHADVDASQRTLANTASAVRRSLGVDAEGPRLHPVTSSGLYVTHGVSSDIETFFSLVVRARQLPVGDASPLCHQALLLIKGEPLASALRGFEWFLAEGHGARLARDGEWAALALHHTALEKGNYELAFWAIQQGRLIDPYSDALNDALTRVPRLREFGGDGSGRAQDRTVGPRGAVAMSWSFSRFSQQVSK